MKAVQGERAELLRRRLKKNGRERKHSTGSAFQGSRESLPRGCTQRYILMKMKKMLSAVLASALVIGSVNPCFASATQQKIDEAQKQKQEMESSISEAQDKIDALESKKGQSESYLEDLNGQLEELKNSLQKLQDEYDDKQAELGQVQKELEEAKASEAQQYNDMKIRIQYMYENSSTSYVEMFLSADSISEFLSRAVNIAQLSEYDRELLEEYQETREQIAEKEKQVIQEKEEIQELQIQSQDKQAEVSELIEATYNEIRSYQDSISQAQSEQADLLAEVSAQEEEINSLIRQAKEEEIAAQKAEEEAQRQREEAEAAQNQQNSSSGTGGSTAQTPAQDETQDSTGDSGNSSQGKYLGKFRLTSYCACSICCGSWSGGPTASGTVPTAGRTVAMGGVPFGTKLLINGHIYIVEDRGTAYGHVDIFSNSHSEALAFGSKYADVYLVE